MSYATLLRSRSMPSNRCSLSACTFLERASSVAKRRIRAVLMLISTSSLNGSSDVTASLTRSSMRCLISITSTSMPHRISTALHFSLRMMPRSRCSGFMVLLRRRVASSLLNDSISVIFCENSFLISSSSNYSLLNIRIRLFFRMRR